MRLRPMFLWDLCFGYCVMGYQYSVWELKDPSRLEGSLGKIKRIKSVW